MSKLTKAFLTLMVVGLAIGLPAGGLTPVHAAGVTLAAPAEAPTSPLDDGTIWLYLLPAIGAIRIKDTASLAKKFVTRAGQATPDYTDGVKAAGADWETGARNGEDNYKLSVTQAANEGRYGKGVTAAGQQKFVTKASTLGAQRYGPGVQSSEADWAKGSQPFLDALKSIELPPKRPRGQNAGRADAVAQRLHAMRVGK